MWYASLLTSVAFAFRAAHGAEVTVVLGGGDNYQGGTVHDGAIDCVGGICAHESDQSVGIHSLHDIAHGAGTFANLPAEVRTAVVDRVFGARLLDAVEEDTDPGDHFGSYYSQIAVSKVQVKAPANDVTCIVSGDDIGDGTPSSYAGVASNCAASVDVDELASAPSQHAAQLCVGLEQDADERCQEVWWRGRTVGVLPYMDITATNAVDDTTIDPAYPVNMRSRLSNFNEKALKYDSAAGKLVRENTGGDTYCSYDPDAHADEDPTFAYMMNYNCAGDHFCPPSTDAPMFDTSGQFARTFMDRCFPYKLMTNGQQRFTMTAEPGTPPPGDWNKAGWGYESALLESYDCDPGDPTSENILLGVDDNDHPKCLYSQADKLGAGAKITLVDPSGNELLNGPNVYQQHVMYYAPVHVFVTEGGTAYRYTIRATMPMFWGLLAGVLYSSEQDVAVPDITFPLADPHHINLGYDWLPGNGAPGRWRPPMPSATNADGEPTTYVIGTIMNVRYNGVAFDCVADDEPCSGGPNTSYQGITNLEERAFKFATRLTIDRTTVGGLVSADTVVSGVALDLALNSQACYKYDLSSPPDLIFTLSFSGLEEVFVVSVQSIEYFHKSTGARIVFASDAVACARTGASSTPGPGCFDVVAGSAPRSATDRYAVTAAVKLPMDTCVDDFNAPTTVGDCAAKLGTWLAATSGATAERKIFVTYTMAFGDNTGAAQGFVRRQEISCDNAGIYCNALIRADAESNLNQCDEDSAVGTEITINQFTDLVSASLAVVGQPRFHALQTRPPCIALDPSSGDETVTCPAMLHDQCEGSKGVASVQHIMEQCGAMYSMPNIKAHNMIVTGGPDAGPPGCLHCTFGVRTQLVDDCGDVTDETACNVAYDQAINGGGLNDQRLGGVCRWQNNACARPDICHFPDHPSYPTCDGSRRLQTTTGDEIDSDVSVTAGAPVPVLGNGLGFMHLGAVAGPKTQPTTKQQAARQLIFPVGARLTAKCGDTEQLAAPLFGGFDTAGAWLLTADEWEHSLGMPAARYGAMKELMEDADTLALIEPALKAIDEDTLLTARLVAVDSPAAHALATQAASSDIYPLVGQGYCFQGAGMFEYVKDGAPSVSQDACRDACTAATGYECVGYEYDIVNEESCRHYSGGTLTDIIGNANMRCYRRVVANSISCEHNTIKPFAFFDQTRADDFCTWADALDTEYHAACSSQSGLGGGLDVQGFLAAASAGISHGPTSAADCHNGPAFVLGFNDQSPQYMADPESLAAPDQVPPCAPESNRDRDGDVVQHDADSATCDGLGIDDVCTDDAGYRGCALLPMQNDLETAVGTLPSFYDRFKTQHTADGRPSAAVMSALGVNVNTAYLSQCGSDPTEWILETQFVHIDGLTPLGTAGSHTDPVGTCTYVSPTVGGTDYVRTMPVHNCSEVAAAECNDAYTVWDRSVCFLDGDNCVRLDDVCEFSSAPAPPGPACVTIGCVERTVFTDNCANYNGDEAGCNNAYTFSVWNPSNPIEGAICAWASNVNECTRPSTCYLPGHNDYPSCGGARRLTTTSVYNTYHVEGSNETDEADAAPTNGTRALQEAGANETHGSIITAQTEGVALPCSDATVGVYGVFGQACLCDPHSTGSPQCSIEFVNTTPPPPPPPPPPPSDMDDSDWIAVVGIGFILCLMVVQLQKQSDDVMTVINLQQSLLSRGKP